MTDLPRVVMCSMWQNDSDRRIVDRVEHLLAKAETYPNLRWLWVVGDSSDDTAETLAYLSTGYDVRIVEFTTGIEGEDAPSRLRRLSATANVYLDSLTGYDEYLLIYESDIQSPSDVVNRLVVHAQAGRCPIAGWPVITLPGHDTPQLYDTWAYRADGQRFGAYPDYHKRYHPDAPFTVDSAGTMMLIDAADAPHIRMTDGAFLDICAGLRAQGRSIWVDPTLTIEQPTDLWIPR